MEQRAVTNPFPGLRPFETDEYRLFFGRDGQSDELLARLQRARFLAVVGTSGSGKSSLIRAGLLPALRGGMMAGAGSGWRIAVMRPGGDPIGNLAHELAQKDLLAEAGGGLSAGEAEAVIEATLRGGSLGLVDAAYQGRLGEHEKLLVVVDQFEELFRFRSAPEKIGSSDEASAFVKLLLEAARQRELSIYVVLTMRSDFLGDCAQFQGLPEAINEGQYLIPRMTRDERRFAVTGPVGVTRGKIAEPLVNRLLNDVGDNPDQLPILQHALMRTWDYWSTHRRNGEPIGLEHYEAVGTMSDALSLHADEAWEELDQRGQVVAELLFKTLTERGADNREIRRPTSLQDICAITNTTAAEVVAVIDVFRGAGRSFLMPPAGVALKPETVVDISHESLIRNWDRLKAWVEDEAQSARIYRRLAEAATDYYQKAGGLLDDVTLQYVMKWHGQETPQWAWGVRYHPAFNAAMSYLEESTLARDARIEAEQERDRREQEASRAFAEAERQRNEERAAAQQRELEAAHAFAEAERQRNEERAAAQQRELEAAHAFAEAERLRNEERAAAQERDLAQARELAAEQARSAQRLRRFAFALVLLSLLALSTAGISVYAFSKARRSEAEAKRSEILALEQQKKAEDLTEALQKSSTALEANYKTLETQKVKADELATKLTEEKKKTDDALIAEKAAVEKQKETLLAQQKATATAKENEALAQAAKARGELMRNGLETSRRGDSDQAYRYFDHLITQLKDAIKSAHQSRPESVDDLNFDLGWALSNLSAEQRRQRSFRQAIENYEQARAILTKVLKVNEDDLKVDDKASLVTEPAAAPLTDEQEEARSVELTRRWTLFDTYDGLGHAYQNKAKELTRRIKTKDEEQKEFSQAEEFFKKALAYQQKYKSAESVEAATSHQNLARLYTDMGRFEDAEKNYRRVVEIDRKIEENSSADATIAALKQFAEFYREQSRYEDAARAYIELIDLQERSDAGKYGRDVAESYSDLGQVFTSLQDENRARAMFKLADKIQEFRLKEKQAYAKGRSGNYVLGFDGEYDALGDAYVEAGRFAQAQDAFENSLHIRQVDEKQSGERWQSYERLAMLNLKYLKDYNKAAEFFGYVIELRKERADKHYTDALLELGKLKARELDQPAEAEQAFNAALAVFAARKSQSVLTWRDEFATYWALIDLYRRQNNGNELEKAYTRLREAMTQHFRSLTGTEDPLDRSVTAYLYLKAISEAARFYQEQKRLAEAETVYKLAFDEPAFVGLIVSGSNMWLALYGDVLKNYELLLNELKKPDEAAKVEGLLRQVRTMQEAVDPKRNGSPGTTPQSLPTPQP